VRTPPARAELREQRVGRVHLDVGDAAVVDQSAALVQHPCPAGFDRHFAAAGEQADERLALADHLHLLVAQGQQPIADALQQLVRLRTAPRGRRGGAARGGLLAGPRQTLGGAQQRVLDPLLTVAHVDQHVFDAAQVEGLALADPTGHVAAQVAEFGDLAALQVELLPLALGQVPQAVEATAEQEQAEHQQPGHERAPTGAVDGGEEGRGAGDHGRRIRPAPGRLHAPTRRRGARRRFPPGALVEFRAMPRPWPLALSIGALTIVALLLFAGAPSPARQARLAALEAHRLLGEPSQATAEGAASGADVDRWLALDVLTGPHTRLESEGRAVLRLGAVRAELLDNGGDPQFAAQTAAIARRSLVLGLRKVAEDPTYGGERDDDAGLGRRSLAVEGELEPVAGGAEFVLRRSESGLELTYLPGADLPSLAAHRTWSPPGTRSLLPPVVAILLAVLTRRPLLSLFAGVACGAVLVRLEGGASLGAGLAAGLLDVPVVYLSERLFAENDLYIVAFVVLMLAMVGNLVRNGGLAGLAQGVRRLAKDARSTQFASWIMGLLVFFDDYANTILVGSTMRPLCDRFRVSREKLAYIVDSTSAPVAGLSIFSTWIAFEVGTFSAQLPAAGLLSTDGYQVFLQTLPFRFYCLLTLVMVGLSTFTGRDFGPMRRAELRARSTGQLVRPGSQPMVSKASTELEPAAGVEPALWRAAVPLAGFLGTTLLAIAWRGGAFGRGPDDAPLASLQGITEVLYNGSGNYPLMLGGAVGFALAALATLSAGLGVGELLRSAWNTLRSMGVALGILYLAWMIGGVCGALGTQSYLTALIENSLSPALLPVVLLLLAGVTAFATGSSWSTMGILLPLVVGLSYRLGLELEIGGLGLMFLCIGAVLEGAIFGDHCSPISDTTVLSSIASASDLIDHVRTQLPYGLCVMGISITCGYLPCALLGWSPWISIGLGVAAVVALVTLVGKRTPDAPQAA
jgi:Na+/H+ antiporter NhaC